MEQEVRVIPKKWWKLLGNNILDYIKGKPGSHQSNVQGVEFHYHLHNAKTSLHFLQPTIIVIIKGKKHVRIGNTNYTYNEKSYFLSGIDMPVSSCTVPDNGSPYLSMSISLEIPLILEIAQKLPIEYNSQKCTFAGLLIYDINPELLDCMLRLTELSITNAPDELINNLTIQELHSRLLQSPSGNILFNLAKPQTQLAQIVKSINYIKINYSRYLTIDELAKLASMAPSTYYKYFKIITALSPLQYIKRLRLSEANSLLQSGKYDINQASTLVGYKSNSQFIRDYKLLYGESPYKNIHKKLITEFQELREGE